MSYGKLIQAGAMFGALKIGTHIGSQINAASVKSTLVQQGYRLTFIEAFCKEHPDFGSQNVDSLLDLFTSKVVYRQLFAKYGEDVADLYLSKKRKASDLGVDYDYDSELSKAITIHRNEQVGDAFTSVVREAILAPEGGEAMMETPPAKPVDVSEINGHKYRQSGPSSYVIVKGKHVGKHFTSFEELEDFAKSH